MPRLLVFDNCEEEALLESWRPTSGGCRVLVTSRRSNWTPTLGVTVLPLDLLPRADSVELLRRYRPDLTPDAVGLDAVAAELGDLPLALHLAGSYLHAYRSDVSLDAYLAELRRSDIVQQRISENNAYASYAEIRRQLFEAARIGYDAST